MIGRAFSPHRCLLASETRADGQAIGLGWYGGAPSVLGLAATRTSSPKRVAIPAEKAPLCYSSRTVGISTIEKLIWTGVEIHSHLENGLS
jgi:hypothetical protein